MSGSELSGNETKAIESPPVRLMLVDDHEIVRVGLRTLFEQEAAIEIVGEAATAEEAVREAAVLKPQVILMDVRLPDRSGVEACREIRSSCPETAVIFLTSYDDDEAVVAAIFAGAQGFMRKEAGGQALVDAVRTVGSGQSMLDPRDKQFVHAYLRALATPRPGEVAALSAQERRVLAEVAGGKTNKEIGTTLGLSEKTVRNYLSNIFKKLKIHRRAEAAAYFARRDGA